MDHNTMLTDGSTKLAEVLARTRAFDPADYVQFRQILAEFRRGDNAEMALFARKMTEIYDCTARLYELRRKMPESARPIRKIMAEIVRLLDTIDRSSERQANERGKAVNVNGLDSKT